MKKFCMAATFMFFIFCCFAADTGKIRIRVLEKYMPEEITITGPDKNTVMINARAIGRKTIMPFGLKTGDYRIKSGSIERVYRGNIEVSKDTNGRIKLIVISDIEDCAACAAASEMSPDVFSTESAKALVILTRSYAVLNLKRHKDYDLCDLTHCELYRGLPYDFERWKKYASETRGMIIKDKDGGNAAFFSTCCGGTLENYKEAWGKKNPKNSVVRYDRLNGKTLCENNGFFSWEREILKSELERVSGKKGIKDFNVTRRTSSGRADEFEIILNSGMVYKYDAGIFMSKFGREFGWNRIPSRLFNIKKEQDKYILFGNGLGHGCGMCLAGAKALAEKGYGFMEIIKFYFPDVVFLQI